MNLLAHAFLSFGNRDVLTGNMISDFIKGRKQYDFPLPIQAGIQLHRAIDAFTDTHEATKEMKKFFAPAYRLYSGAFADVAYDYFVANDTSNFKSEEALLSFTEKTYQQLKENSEWLGEKFTSMFPHMQEHNWLYNYRLDTGIARSFGGLQHRSKYIAETVTATTIFLKEKAAMQELYDIFFPDVKKFAKERMANLLQDGMLSLRQEH